MKNVCDFCQGDGYIEDEYGEWKLEAVKLTPLPPVVLSGGGEPIPYHAEAPYWAMFMKYSDEDYTVGEKASFPINFCPVCGRQLNENYPTHYERNTLVLSAKDWVSFQRSLRDPERIKRRDEFFKELDSMDIKKNPDGSWEVPSELFDRRFENEES